MFNLLSNQMSAKKGLQKLEAPCTGNHENHVHSKALNRFLKGKLEITSVSTDRRLDTCIVIPVWGWPHCTGASDSTYVWQCPCYHTQGCAQVIGVYMSYGNRDRKLKIQMIHCQGLTNVVELFLWTKQGSIKIHAREESDWMAFWALQSLVIFISCWLEGIWACIYSPLFVRYFVIM